MRTTLFFFGYLLLCLLLAVWLSVPLMATGWFDYTPERVLGNLAQLCILLSLWPFLALLGLADRQSLGYGVGLAVWRRAVLLGWLHGVGILLVLVYLLLWLGIRVPDPRLDPWYQLLVKAVQAFLGGALIGLLEETFFRGALYTAIRQREGWPAAVLWSALLFAVLHFMKPGTLPEGAVFDHAASLWMLAQVFIDLLQWRHLDSLVALFLVGVFLALVRESSGHIGWCIGLHAGWVFVIQVSRRLTDSDTTAPLTFLAGDYDGIIGWLAALWIGLLSLPVWIWLRLQARR